LRHFYFVDKEGIVIHYRFRTVECDPGIRNEVCDKILEMFNDCDFAAIIRPFRKDDQTGLCFRGLKGGVDLSKIVEEMFGGRGHPTSAGATIHGPKSKALEGLSPDQIKEKRLVAGDLDVLFPLV
jgi:hypothetical protein